MQSNANPVENPQLIKLNVDMMSDRKTKFVWILFGVVIIFFYLLTLAIPDALKVRETSFGSCPVQASPDSDECKQFDLQRHPIFTGLMRDMSEYNNFFFLNMQPIRKNTSGFYFTGESFLLIVTRTDITFILYFNFVMSRVGPDGVQILATLQNKTNHSISVTCHKGEDICEKRVIVYEPRVEFSDYQVKITFLNPSEASATIGEIRFTFLTMAQRYAQFLLMTRYAFFAASAVALIAYLHRLRKIDKRDRVFEQKYILALSISLIWFNDPIYALTLLSQYFIPALLSTIFVVTFYCLILLFWLVQLERISQENERKGTKMMKAWKICLIAVIWLTLIISYATISYFYQEDPAIDLDSEYSQTYELFKIFSLLLALIVLGIFVNYYIHICRTWTTRSSRHKTFFLFSNYFIFCAFLFIFTGSLSVFSYNGNRVLIVISVSNVYIFFLQYFYGPSEQGIREAQEYQKIEMQRLYNQYEYLNEDAIELNFEQEVQEEHLSPNEEPNYGGNPGRNGHNNNGNAAYAAEEDQHAF